MLMSLPLVPASGAGSSDPSHSMQYERPFFRERAASGPLGTLPLSWPRCLSGASRLRRGRLDRSDEPNGQKTNIDRAQAPNGISWGIGYVP